MRLLVMHGMAGLQFRIGAEEARRMQAVGDSVTDDKTWRH
jgi:hypothetical protein